jgi:hypothetical protein
LYNYALKHFVLFVLQQEETKSQQKMKNLTKMKVSKIWR